MAEETLEQKTMKTGSGRGRLEERLRNRHPDRTYEDDEAFYGGISEDFDDMDRQLGEYKEREHTITDMFNSDPRSASFLAAWHNGEDPVIGLIERFGPEIREALDDPDRKEELAKINKEYVERAAQSKKLEEEYEKNIEESLKVFDQFKAERGLSDDEADRIFQYLIEGVQKGIAGLFPRESMENAMKALHYDSDVSDAEHVGEVKGRNARISEKLRKGKKGDGIATLDGKGGQTAQPARHRSIFDEARGAL